METTKLLIPFTRGFGDQFVCNGLVNCLSTLVDEIHIPLPKHQLETIKTLYKDNEKVTIFECDPEPYYVANFEKIDEWDFNQKMKDYAEQNNLILYNKYWDNWHNFKNPKYQRQIYEWFNINYQARYDYFHLPENHHSNNLYEFLAKDKSYAFVHNQASCGKFDLNINTNLHIIQTNESITDNMLNYQKIIEEATEIHCIDTSFYHLIENMTVKGKLYFHDVRNTPDNRIEVSDKWGKISYDLFQHHKL